MGLAGLSAMSLGGSGFSTPKSSVVGLPDEEQDKVVVVGGGKEGLELGRRDGDVKIVGMDVEVGEMGGEERGLAKMDVDG
jgi:hypothetical protein